LRSRGEKEIHPRSIGSGACCRVNGLDAELLAQNFRCLVHIAHQQFNLLDSFAEFLKKASDGSAPLGLLARQNVELNARGKVQFVFFGVLVRRDV